MQDRTAKPQETSTSTAALRISHEDLLSEILQDFFAIHDPAFTQTLIDGATFLEIAPGERLFRQGDRSSDVYFVLNGRMKAIREDGPDAPREIGEITRGETIGELAFVSGEPRTASVVAVRATILAKIERARFEEIIGARPKIALEVMRIIVTRFRAAGRLDHQPRRPVTICLVAVSPNVDLAALADDLIRHASRYGGRIRALGRRDAEARFDALDVEGYARLEVSRWIDDVEAAHAAVLLVADATPTSWSRHCVGHADEIVLVGDGDGSAATSELEAELFDSAEIARLTRRTLLLLHRPGKHSPTGTRRWLAVRDVARHIHVRRNDDRHMSRLARLLSGRGIGVVLSGGGARGFAHIGVLQALSEAGIEADVIGGSSIGAVMGAWQAMEVRGAALAETARHCFVDAGNPIGDYNAFPFVSLVAGRRVRRLTEQAIRDVAGADIDIEDSWVTFYCIAGNYSASCQAVLRRGPLAKALLASFAIPGILPPIVIDGHLHVDGGTINNLPVDVMQGYGLSKIIAVDLLSHKATEVDYEWVPSTAALLRNKLRGGTLRRLSIPPITEILLKAGVLNTHVQQRGMRDRADLCITPDLPRIGLLDWKKHAAAVAGGLETARERIAGLDPATVESFR